MKFLLPLLFVSFHLQASISAIYNSLDPNSISKHLSFYKLYPDTKEGKKAIKHAWALLKKDNTKALELPKIDISNFISLITKDPNKKKEIDKETISLIKELGKSLKNIKGTDIARELLLAHNIKDIGYYEAVIDLMALQIKATLPKSPSPKEMIDAINRFIYFDMKFSFPPLSSYRDSIQSYTLLTSVLDSRKGVCLGLSILYLAIAQRLGLTLQAVTPPGHIFLRHVDKDGNIINIETTNRGIDIESKYYLKIDTKELETKTLKEVIGLSFINEVSTYLQKKEFKKAIELYEKALIYLPSYNLLKELLGFSYIFFGDKKRGRSILLSIKNSQSKYSTKKDTLISDFLNRRTDAEAILEIFIPYEDKRDEIAIKIEKFEKIIKKYPLFRDGIVALFSCYIKLGRLKEAFHTLSKYKDPKDPSITFYLAVIAYRRFDLKTSWKYLKLTEKLLGKYLPREVLEFKRELLKSSLN